MTDTLRLIRSLDASQLAPKDKQLVATHLEELLASRIFAPSIRTKDFLRLLIEYTLDDRSDELHERMIGATLFGRPIDYDTGSDSVVRVRATEARKKLALYYAQPHQGEWPVQLELPPGSYIPKFHFAIPPEPPAQAIAPPVLPANSDSQPPVELQRRKIGNFRILVAALLSVAILIGIFFAYRILRHSAGHSGIQSIVILPLENISGEAAQDYYADGLTEEMINDLGQLSSLRVISLTSSMSFKGTHKKLPEIAKELSVDAVVEGAVLREGNQVRISAQLIDARSDQPIWARTYLRQVNQGPGWQAEVAATIINEIGEKLRPSEALRITHPHQADVQAQDLFLHGILARNTDNCTEAINDFRHALDLDPAYGEAHSALASCYGRLGESGSMAYQQAFSLQKQEALKAIELDDSISEAHAERANAAMTLDHDWNLAASEFRRALELNPNSSANHQKYAFYLVRLGHPDQALAEIQRAIELDPISGSTFHSEGFVYFFSRNYDQAMKVYQQANGLHLGLPDWNLLLGNILAEEHRYPEAISAYSAAAPTPYTLGHLGYTQAMAGHKPQALALISQLQAHILSTGVGRYEIAIIQSGLGDREAALHSLEEALAAHDPGIVYLKTDPCLDPLRSDPRFLSLLDRAGLPR